jgi:hypothetical protein
VNEEPQRACAEIVWDGPYKMTCSYMIVNGRCVRHGTGGLTYEVEPRNQQ